MTLRAYRDFDPNDPDNYNNPNQAYDTGDDNKDFKGTFLDEGYQNYAYRGQGAPVIQKSRMFWVAGVLGLVAIGFAVAFAISAQSGSDVPVIVAENTAFKTKPETPGGIEIPFQDKMVFNRLDPAGEPVQAERLLPPPEQPMTLALQPGQRQPSNPTPKEILAVEDVAVTAGTATKNKAATAVVPEVAEATPIEAIAPSAGAVPPPINAPVNETVAEVAPTAQAVAAPAASQAVAKPVAPAAPKAAAKPEAKPEGAAPVAAAAPPAPAVAGGSRVQLASLPERAAAERALSKLTKDFGGSLGGAKMGLVRAEIPGKGTFWRVQSQPMERATAERICNAVKAKGGACLLAR